MGIFGEVKWILSRTVIVSLGFYTFFKIFVTHGGVSERDTSIRYTSFSASDVSAHVQSLPSAIIRHCVCPGCAVCIASRPIHYLHCLVRVDSWS